MGLIKVYVLFSHDSHENRAGWIFVCLSASLSDIWMHVQWEYISRCRVGLIFSILLSFLCDFYRPNTPWNEWENNLIEWQRAQQDPNDSHRHQAIWRSKSNSHAALIQFKHHDKDSHHYNLAFNYRWRICADRLKERTPCEFKSYVARPTCAIRASLLSEKDSYVVIFAAVYTLVVVRGFGEKGEQGVLAF